VHTYTDLRSYLPDVTPAQRRKRHLADALPQPPGVYLFRGPSAEVLYVGTAVDLRRRVGQYFNGADPRTRIKEMASLATAVDHVECAHDLEAGVRELRLLAAHAPPYNRRSKFPHRWWWVSLTDEAFPRFSIVRDPEATARSGRSGRAPTRSRPPLLARFTGCARAPRGWPLARTARCPERELSPCPAPRGITPPSTPRAPAGRRADRRHDNRALARCCRHRRLAERNRYETAARLRDHAAAADRRAVARPAAAGAGRGHRTGGRRARRRRRLALAVIRHGQLARGGQRRRGVPPMPVVDAICAGAQAVLPTDAPLGGALVEETALIARWLAQPGVRIVRAEPAGRHRSASAGRWAAWAASARSARAGRRADARTLRAC
jgi:DNA polymerase-3 subunit epsilon